MNGLLLLYSFWLGVTSALDGVTQNLLAAGLIAIATLATLGLLLRDENDRGAAAIGVALGVCILSIDIGSPLPSLLLPWGHVAVMAWGFLATYAPAIPGQLLFSRSGPTLPKSPALSSTHKAQMAKAELSGRFKSALGDS